MSDGERQHAFTREEELAMRAAGLNPAASGESVREFLAAYRQPRVREDDPGEPQHGHKRIGISLDEDAVLGALARGRTVLEVGTGLGYSTRAMLHGGAARVVTVDPDPWVHRVIWPELRRYEPNVGLLEMLRELRELRELPSAAAMQFDMAFIDGAHDYSSVRHDAVECARRVLPGGLLVFHDWTGIDPVAAAVHSALGPSSPSSTFRISTRYGLGVVVVSREIKRGVGS